MNTDRELLELAAKAAGKDIDLTRYDEDDGFAIRDMAVWWNPLNNDGDALRLAATLEVDIKFAAKKVSCSARYNRADRVYPKLMGKNRFDSTRRVIVMMAADIGKYCAKERASLPLGWMALFFALSYLVLDGFFPSPWVWVLSALITAAFWANDMSSWLTDLGCDVPGFRERKK